MKEENTKKKYEFLATIPCYNHHNGLNFLPVKPKPKQKKKLEIFKQKFCLIWWVLWFHGFGFGFGFGFSRYSIFFFFCFATKTQQRNVAKKKKPRREKTLKKINKINMKEKRLTRQRTYINAMRMNE